MQVFERDLLVFIKRLKRLTPNKLPICGATPLRPKIKLPSIKRLGAGGFAYIGILYLLNVTGDVLFDTSSPTTKLLVNIDGVPLFKSRNFSLWLVLGSVGEKPIFLIGLYDGPKKPKCSNQYLRSFV